MKNKNKIAAIMAVSMLCFPAVAQEQNEEGPYGGVSVGSMSFEDSSEVVNGVRVDANVDNGVGVRAFGGYNVNKFLGVEGGFIYSKLDFNITDGVNRATGDLKVSAFDLGIVGKFPINDYVSPFGRVGLAIWDAEAEVAGVTVDDDGTDLMFGLGLEISPTDNIAIRGEWSRINADDNVDFISLSAIYEF